MDLQSIDCFLCVETSSSLGSLALFKKRSDGQYSHFFEIWEKKSSHSETLLDHFHRLLENSKTKVSNLQLICVDGGPGSFTGLRVGMSFAKSLSYAQNIPIVNFDSLTLLSFQLFREHNLNSGHILAFVNAFSNNLYFSVFEVCTIELKMVVSPRAVESDHLEELLNFDRYYVIGDAYEAYADKFSSKLLSKFNLIAKEHAPKSSTLGEIFLASRISAIPKSWKDVNPLYIRGSEAEEKLRKGLLKPVTEF